MINKLKLQSVINKYYLNSLIESVKWDVKDNILNIKFTSPTKEMLGEVTYNNFTLPDSSVGISNTSQLLKLLNITSGDLLLDYVKTNRVYTKLIISDNQFTVNYSLADTLTIPKSGTYNGPDEYNLEIDLYSENINALIKAKSALPDSETVMIKSSTTIDGEFQLELIFGGDVEYANKVSYYILELTKNNTNTDFELGFNSDLLKEILSCNKEADSAKMSINLEGLIKLEFTTEDTKSTYYIVKKDI